FHAQDGIRDRNVTGVQTCALPISKYLATNGGAALTSAKKDARKAARERVKEESETEKNRVKEFDRIPGVRGDADTGLGKAKRRVIRQAGKDIAPLAIGGAVGGMAKKSTDPIRKNKYVKKAKGKLAKEFVPKGVQKGVKTAKRDAGRVFEEAASGAVDGAVTGGKVGAIKGAVQGTVRGLLQSKTAWAVFGISSAAMLLIAMAMSMALVIAMGVAQKAESDWRAQAADKAVETYATAKDFASTAKDAAKSAADATVDGAEWVVGAAASKAAGVADSVGGVRDNDDDKGKSDDEDED